MKHMYPSGVTKRKEKNRKYRDVERSSKSLNTWLTSSTSQSQKQPLSHNDTSYTDDYELLYPLDLHSDDDLGKFFKHASRVRHTLWILPWISASLTSC